MSENGNIFDQGVLIRLSIGTWEGKIKLPVSELNPEEDVDKTLLSARKALVDGKHLDPIRQIRSEAYSALYANSFDFPIKGVAFAPKGLAASVVKEFEAKSATFHQAADSFAASYETFISEAQTRLGGLFKRTDYPTPEDMRAKFRFSWELFTLSEPTNPGIFDSETFEEEKAKYRNMHSEFREQITATLREQFLDLVSTMAVNMADPKKIFKHTSVDSFLEFLKKFDAMNVNDDADLANLIGKARDYTQGHTGKTFAATMRDLPDLRKEAGRIFRNIQGSVKNLIEDAPTRKMRTLVAVQNGEEGTEDAPGDTIGSQGTIGTPPQEIGPSCADFSAPGQKALF